MLNSRLDSGSPCLEPFWISKISLSSSVYYEIFVGTDNPWKIHSLVSCTELHSRYRQEGQGVSGKPGGSAGEAENQRVTVQINEGNNVDERESRPKRLGELSEQARLLEWQHR